jgi:proteasome lid subunit RPN8/RPN11
MTFWISREAYEQMRRSAEAAYPMECCGVLVGDLVADGKRATRAEAASNASEGSQRNRYAIAPMELIRIEREARRAGMEMVGFYHSHPDAEARWSATDLEEAHWLGCSYVITAVREGNATETRSFLLAGASENEKRFEEEQLAVDSDL